MSIGQLGIKIAKVLRKNLGLTIGELGGSNNIKNKFITLYNMKMRFFFNKHIDKIFSLKFKLNNKFKLLLDNLQ